MLLGGGGGSGHFVGLDPAAAGSLVAAMGAAGDRSSAAATRVGSLLAEAGSSGTGAHTPSVLRQISHFLDTARADVRWRAALLSAGAGGARGMVVRYLPFASAAAARSAGAAHAAEMEAALWRWVRSDGAEADAAREEYFALMRAAGVGGDDPAWAGGLADALGADGISNVVYFTQVDTQGDVDRTRQMIAPVAAALATAMRHATAAPGLARQLLQSSNRELGLLLTSARPATDFLAAAAKSRLVDAEWTDDRGDDLIGEETVWFLEALAQDPEASYRVLTGIGPAEERNAVHLLRPMTVLTDADAATAAGRVLEQGLVVHPRTHGAPVWNEAVATTSAVVGYTGSIGWALRDHPDLSQSLLRLVHPHLDALAVIGAASSGIDPGPYDLHRPLPDCRSMLAVGPEELQKFLGAVLQTEESVAHMQALVAGYAQSDEVQAHRLPLIEHEGRVRDLEPFMADSLRIAGLVGVVGQGLDIAGHDEERRTRLLTGAVGFASDKGIGKVVGWTGPAGWLAKETAGRGAGWATDRFSEWVATFEPAEGEEGVDAFLAAFDDATEASLREQMAADPRLAQLPPAERETVLAHAVRISGDLVRANLLEVYAGLTSETAGEGQ